MIESDEIDRLGLRKDKNNEWSDLMRIEKLETQSEMFDCKLPCNWKQFCTLSLHSFYQRRWRFAWSSVALTLSKSRTQKQRYFFVITVLVVLIGNSVFSNEVPGMNTWTNLGRSDRQTQPYLQTQDLQERKVVPSASLWQVLISHNNQVSHT